MVRFTSAYGYASCVFRGVTRSRKPHRGLQMLHRWLRVGSVLLAAGLLILPVASSGRITSGVASAASSCTQIVGFSQTMQWYFGGFKTPANSANWELRWEGGGSIGNWADPNYSGWTDAYLVDGCAQAVNSPDRALINISDDF